MLTHVSYVDICNDDPTSIETRKNVKSVIVPASVVEISPSAFQESMLEEIIFEDNSSITTIGKLAFRGCKYLKSIIIPASIITIAEGAFLFSNLEKITFAGKSELQTIGRAAFKSCKCLKSINIPASVVHIDVRAFGDSPLNEVTFVEGSKLEVIGEKAFWQCEFLKSIIIPASVIKISNHVFDDSTIENITFEHQSKLKIIAECAFSGCNIKSIKIPSSVVKISNNAFFYATVDELTFEDNSELETISQYAFENCIVKSIVIPTSVTTIANKAFSDATIEEITFAENSKLHTISPSAFSQCNLKSINIPASVIKIGNSAFCDSTIEIVTFADNSQLQTIDEYAFTNCNALKSIIIPRLSVKLADNAFFGSAVTEIGFGDSQKMQTKENNEYFVQLCRDGNVDKCEEYFANNNINLSYEAARSETAIGISISTRNAALCRFLIKNNAHVNSGYSQYTICDIIADEDILDIMFDTSKSLLQTVTTSLQKKNYKLVSKLLQNLKKKIELGIWKHISSTKTYNIPILQPILQRNSLDLYHLCADCGILVNHTNLDLFLKLSNVGNIYDSILQTFLHSLATLSAGDLQNCLEIAIQYGNEHILKKCIQTLTEMKYPFYVNLKKSVDVGFSTKPLLCCIPYLKLDIIIPLLVPYIKDINAIIKEADYEETSMFFEYPETILSYLVSTKSFLAFKFIIESVLPSLKPTHLVACSLFRGYFANRSSKHSIDVYTEMFEYLMRDDIRLQLLGLDKEWIDKSIFICIRYGSEMMTLKLLDLGVDLNNIYIHRSCKEVHIIFQRYTLLSYACKYQGYNVVKELIKRGIPVDGTMIDILGENKVSRVIKRDGMCDTMDEDCDGDGDGDEGDGGDDDHNSGGFDEKREKIDKRSIQFLYESDTIPDLSDNPWYIPYFCRRTMNRNQDIPDYDQDGEFDAGLVLYFFNMTPLAVAIHHSKSEIVQILLEHGANPNALSMLNIPTLYSITDMVLSDLCYCSECLQGPGIETCSGLKTNLDPLDTIVCDEDEYIYDENWDRDLICQNHKLQSSDKIHHTRSLTAMKRHHIDNNIDIELLDSQKKQKLIDSPEKPTVTSNNVCSEVDKEENKNTESLLSSSSPTVFATILKSLLDHGLNLEALFDGEVEINTGDDVALVNFENIVAGFGFDITLILTLAKYDYFSPGQINRYIQSFLEKGCTKETAKDFRSNLGILLQHGLLTDQIKHKYDYLKNAVQNMSGDSSSISALIDYGIISKEIFVDQCSELIRQIGLKRFSTFIKSTKLYPTFFQITMVNPDGISLMFGDDIHSRYKLLQLGLNINHRTKDGDTLLLHSIKINNIKVFQLLLSLGADIDLRTKDGKSCMQVIQASSCDPNMRVILQRHLQLLPLLHKMDEYQNRHCICPDHDLVQEVETVSSPFSHDECNLIQSSYIPGYSVQTLSFFLSKHIEDITCLYCVTKFNINDHCRAMLICNENGIVEEKYSHNVCFHRNDLGPNGKIWNLLTCTASRREDPQFRYIVNPIKPILPKYE